MCADCGWEALIEKIEGMDDSGNFAWAQDTLEGIKETVERMEHCTDRQKEAIANISKARRGDDDEYDPDEDS